MIIRAKDIKMNVTPQGHAEITLTTDDRKVDISKLRAATFNGKLLTVEIKQYRKKRSLDSNAYCWVLCQKIAEATNSTKELIYQEVIRDVGQFTIVLVENPAVQKWVENWKSNGLGWHAEVIDESIMEGYQQVISYYGSSRYKTHEMAVLIDEIVFRCKELGIETLPPDELQRMKNKWTPQVR